jgi:hypothetical protein
MTIHQKWKSWRLLSKDEKTAAIKEFVPTGTSASIAVDLLAQNGIVDCTRSAFIGHYHRTMRKAGEWSLSATLERGRAYTKQGAQRRERAKERARTTAKLFGLPETDFGPVEPFRTIPEPATDKAKTLADLGPKDCRYPLWGDEKTTAESLFCGCEVGTETGFYCEWHFVKCHK